MKLMHRFLLTAVVLRSRTEYWS